MTRVPLKKKHNTRIFKEGLLTQVQLYSTRIMEYDAGSKRLVLYTGGWETAVTRRRMYEAMLEICAGALTNRAFNVYSRKGASVLYLDGREHPFVDGKLEITL